MIRPGSLVRQAVLAAQMVINAHLVLLAQDALNLRSSVRRFLIILDRRILMRQNP